MEAELKTDRREALLEAAIRVVAAQGMRGLTHRAIEAEAGLPHGSTTYYFGTRRDLLVALMAYMAERGSRALEPIAKQLTLQLADRSQPFDIDGLARAMVTWIDSEASVELARYELQVTAARDPEMKELMTRNCHVFQELTLPIAIACGSKQPELDAEIIQAAIDGWMFQRLTNTGPGDEVIPRGVHLLLSAIAND